MSRGDQRLVGGGWMVGRRCANPISSSSGFGGTFLLLRHLISRQHNCCRRTSSREKRRKKEAGRFFKSHDKVGVDLHKRNIFPGIRDTRGKRGWEREGAQGDYYYGGRGVFEEIFLGK